MRCLDTLSGRQDSRGHGRRPDDDVAGNGLFPAMAEQLGVDYLAQSLLRPSPLCAVDLDRHDAGPRERLEMRASVSCHIDHECTGGPRGLAVAVH
jgi:hypothetical protein